jgi:hypothetical protein
MLPGGAVAEHFPRAARAARRRAPARRRPRLSPAAVVLLGLGLLALVAGHTLHEHPHTTGHDAVACAVCTAPLAPSAPADPVIAPPALGRIRFVAGALASAPVPRAPLSFSPKQGPPA